MGILDTLFSKNNSKDVIKRIDPATAKENMAKDKKIILLDVREGYEFANGHIRGAKNISVNQLEKNVAGTIKDKQAPLYVYCQSGARSTRACNVLAQLGYSNVYNLGGIMSWPYEVVK